MALNGTGIEFGKSEHVCRRRISRATTISADFIVLGQRCGVQVFGRKVGHMYRRYPLSFAVRGCLSGTELGGYSACRPLGLKKRVHGWCRAVPIPVAVLGTGRILSAFALSRARVTRVVLSS